MKEMGIYSSDITSQELHLLMEHCTQRNQYYVGMQNYTQDNSFIYVRVLLIVSACAGGSF